MRSEESSQKRSKVFCYIAGLLGLACCVLTQTASAQVGPTDQQLVLRRASLTLSPAPVLAAAPLPPATSASVLSPRGRDGSPMTLSFLARALDPRDHAFSLVRLCVSMGQRRGYGLFFNAQY
jgi:hypothetical protein